MAIKPDVIGPFGYLNQGVGYRMALPSFVYRDFVFADLHPTRDPFQQLKACLKVADFGGKIEKDTFTFNDKIVAYRYTFYGADGKECGHIEVDKKDFGSLPGSPALAPTVHYTGFSYVHDGVEICAVSGLAPISASEFEDKFATLNRFFTIYDDLLALTDGGANCTGGTGNDTFHLGTGPNIVTGAAGDDTLYKADRGNLDFDGGKGIDEIRFQKADGVIFRAPFIQHLEVNLTTGRGLNPYGGKLTLERVEDIEGTDLADKIIGNNADNRIYTAGAKDGLDITNTRGGDDSVFGPSLSEGRADGGRGFDTLGFTGQSLDIEDKAFTDAYRNFEAFAMNTYGGDEFFLRGNDDDNMLIAGFGVDTFEGRGGDDTIHGGNAVNADFTDGADVAVYSGKRKDYRIEVVDFILRVTDKRVGPNDGSDSLHGIETLRFANGDVSVADLFPELAALQADLLTPFAADDLFV